MFLSAIFATILAAVNVGLLVHSPNPVSFGANFITIVLCAVSWARYLKE